MTNSNAIYTGIEVSYNAILSDLNNTLILENNKNSDILDAKNMNIEIFQKKMFNATLSFLARLYACGSLNRRIIHDIVNNLYKS